MDPRPPLRSTPDTIESLRITLQKLEHSPDLTADTVALDELKRVLLNRIAELEIVQALAPADPETPMAPDPAALIPPASETEADRPAAPAQTDQLDKLD